MENRFSSDYLEYYLTPGSVSDSPVRSLGLRTEGDYMDTVHGTDDFIHSGEIPENPGGKLDIYKRRGVVLPVVLFILSVTGEKEKSGGGSGWRTGLPHRAEMPL